MENQKTIYLNDLQFEEYRLHDETEMTFESILSDHSEALVETQEGNLPDHLIDLNLDQLIDAVTASKKDYDLNSFYYSPAKDVDTIHYRQEVARELEKSELNKTIKKFAENMVLVRRYLNMIPKLYYTHHQEGWFLEAALLYCKSVSNLMRDISQMDFDSRGFNEFRKFLIHLTQSNRFKSLFSDSHKVKARLLAIQYSIIIKGNLVKVRKYEDEIDYSKEVDATFEKFKQGEVKNYRIDLPVTSGMNHIDAKILDCVVKLFPEEFEELDVFYEKYQGFVDDTIRNFDREIQFYIAYLDFIEPIKRSGLQFCFPEIAVGDKQINADGSFDLTLADKLTIERSTVVTNDFFLKDPERIIVVSGPNQGGKTTFARMFGQLHYIANLGLPVPGKEARLFLFDNIFTHFEKEEDIQNLRGKLQDDLVRIKRILDQASSESIIILNEIFNSTTLKDSIYLSKNILEKIIQLDALEVCVTFIDELSTLSEQTISMVSTVDPENPAVRTFKIIRKPADGLAYAIHIAEKYHLTYDSIMERIS